MPIEKLIRKNFFWREDQKKFIEDLPGDASFHIRQALDDYIAKEREKRMDASKTPSAQ